MSFLVNLVFQSLYLAIGMPMTFCYLNCVAMAKNEGFSIIK